MDRVLALGHACTLPKMQPMLCVAFDTRQGAATAARRGAYPCSIHRWQAAAGEGNGDAASTCWCPDVCGPLSDGMASLAVWQPLVAKARAAVSGVLDAAPLCVVPVNVKCGASEGELADGGAWGMVIERMCGVEGGAGPGAGPGSGSPERIACPPACSYGLRTDDDGVVVSPPAGVGAGSQCGLARLFRTHVSGAWVEVSALLLRCSRQQGCWPPCCQKFLGACALGSGHGDPDAVVGEALVSRPPMAAVRLFVAARTGEVPKGRCLCATLVACIS